MAVHFYGRKQLDDALLYATNGILGDLVERAAEHAKAGARVDTGFYREHIKGIRPNSTPTPPDLQALIDRRGVLRSYYAPGVDGMPSEEAAVVAMADYSQWLELEDNTVYTGFQNAAAEIHSIAAKHRL